MPSSYTPRLRLEMQAAGENLNTWGAPKLNTVINRLDFAIAGMSTIALTGDYTLTSSNTADDQARSAILKFTGVGSFVVTIPSTSKVYQIWNATTGTVTITAGAGTTVVVAAGEVDLVICDGINVKKIKTTEYGGARITGVGAPSASTDAATKAYVDTTAFGAVDLPGQTGNALKLLTTDGTSASWGDIKFAPSATSPRLYLYTTAGTFAGGVFADPTGPLGFVDAAFGARFLISSDGRAYAYSLSGAARELATQSFAIAAAVAL